MKILFLDIDGVLNSERYIRKCSRCGLAIDPLRLKLVKRIVDETGAEIVLTTSWREHWNADVNGCDDVGREINEIFKDANLRVFDKTPSVERNREKEIEAWLENNPATEAFAVIDDCFLDSEMIRGHFVKTDNYRDGIDEDDAEKAIIILNGVKTLT